MSDNDKNVLQIYCQRAKLPLPIYKQSCDNAGLWISSVTFLHNDKHVTFVGDGCERKSQADISAAGIAVQSLNLGGVDTENGPVIVVNQAHTWSDFCQTAKISMASGSKITMYVLIDYENVNSLRMLNNVYEDASGNKVEVLKFLSYNHHMADRGDASHIVHSAGSDSVDHAISMYVGMLLSYQSKSKSKSESTIIVLTGDGFGERLQNMTQWAPIGESMESTVIHLRSEASCVKTLDSFGYKQTNKRISYVQGERT
jgi:hypothetical protein